MQPVSPRMRSFLERPTLARWLVLFAVLLALPSIVTGLHVDDLMHQALLREIPPFVGVSKGTWQLFTFLDGDPARTRGLVEQGVYPWWTGETTRLAFFRPLSAMTHWMDHRFWPGAPWLMHVHSYLWLAAVVAVATALYRRLLGPTWIAGLAALMFAVHDAHAIPATWIANRNALLSCLFGLLAFGAHRQRSTIEAALFLALGLSSGENALAALGFIVSHALFLEDDAPRSRLARMLPYLPVVLVWVALYRHFGFGTRASTLYIDPGSDPLRYAAVMVERFPQLFFALLIAGPVDAAFFAPRPAGLAFAAFCWVVTIAVATWLYPVVRARKTARFFALAAVLSLLPGCATIPSGRLLMFGSFAAMGLFAEAIAHGAERPARAMFVLRVAIAPVLMVIGNFQMPIAGMLVDRFSRSLPTDAALAEQDVILVTTFDVAASGYLPLRRRLDGGPVPRHLHSMAVADRDVSVSRVDERTLVLRPRDGFLADNFSQLFRRGGFAVGDKVVWHHATLEVLEVNAEGRAAAVSFTFREPLEFRGYRFMATKGKALAPFELPAVGTTVVIPPGVLL